MLSKSPFQRWGLVCFYRNTVFLTIYNGLLYALHTPKIWKRSGEKYKSYGILSKTTHFLSMFSEVGVVQQCTEAQAGAVQEGLTFAVCMLLLFIMECFLSCRVRRTGRSTKLHVFFTKLLTRSVPSTARTGSPRK